MSKLVRVIIPVSDIEQAEDFYFKVFARKGKRISPGKHAFFLDGCQLVCYDPLANGDELGKGWMHHEKQYICFSVKNLDSLFIRIKNIPESTIDSTIQTVNEERLFYAKDPFDNPICFIDEKTFHEE